MFLNLNGQSRCSDAVVSPSVRFDIVVTKWLCDKSWLFVIVGSCLAESAVAYAISRVCTS